MQLKDKTVLVVDDEPELREILAGALQMEGCQTLEAESGNAAYAALEKTPVDAVVSDIRMRNGDGLFLTRKIRERDFRRPPVLLITGYSDYPPEEVFDAGAEALLAKPFNMKTLIRTVKEAIVTPEEKWRRPAPTASVSLSRDMKAMAEETAAGNFKLGHGGFFLKLTQDFPAVGDVVGFTFRFAGDPLGALAGTGRVCWVRKQGLPSSASAIGVVFETLEPGAVKAVLDRIGSLKPKAFIPMA